MTLRIGLRYKLEYRDLQEVLRNYVKLWKFPLLHGTLIHFLCLLLNLCTLSTKKTLSTFWSKRLGISLWINNFTCIVQFEILNNENNSTNYSLPELTKCKHLFHKSSIKSDIDSTQKNTHWCMITIYYCCVMQSWSFDLFGILNQMVLFNTDPSFRLINCLPHKTSYGSLKRLFT